MSTVDLGDLMRELGGTTCRCGRPKQARRTFCSRCYFELPPPLRSALYRGVGEGYEEAYAEAARALGLPTDEPPLDQLKRRAGHQPLPGLEGL